MEGLGTSGGRAAGPVRRVLWFSHTHHGGGAEGAMVEGVRAIAELGIASVVVLPREGPLRGLLEDAGAEVRIASFRWWADAQPRLRRRIFRPALHLAALPRLRRLVRGIGPDLVVTNTLASPAGALAARAAGIPHVWYVHEFGWDDHRLVFDLGANAAFRVADRLSEVLLVASEAVRGYLAERVTPEKIRRVTLSVELSGLAGCSSTDSRFKLVQVAQKVSGKGQEDAVRALALLAEHGVDAVLMLVGRDDDPEYGPRLHSLVAELRVQDRVQMIPFTDDVTRMVADADVALVCSRMEAFGRVTVEAMKVGTPVVGARSGGTAELIREGWNGLTYPPGDVAALAAALERLYHDRELRRTLGKNGRIWATREFTRERYGAELAAAFEEALQRSAGSLRSDACKVVSS